MLCLADRRHSMLVARLSKFLNGRPHRFDFFKLVAGYDPLSFRFAAVAPARLAAQKQRYHHARVKAGSALGWRLGISLRSRFTRASAEMNGGVFGTNSCTLGRSVFRRFPRAEIFASCINVEVQYDHCPCYDEETSRRTLELRRPDPL